MPTSTQRVPLWMALLVILTLPAHSFETCSAHTGLPVPHADSDTQHIGAPCPNAASGVCEICSHPAEPDTDLCDALSEIAALNSPSQHHIERQSIALAATVAVAPAIPQLIALSGCLHGRAEPPPAPFLTSSLRSSLPNRAPPLAA
ncbi:MAG TPA: hypothetical protein VNA16_08185 [Abditibacteriaceae bacterium]|nr:hypothetical protein [Abditibacteriaceae bacterium]